jgi:hypothetical protein
LSSDRTDIEPVEASRRAKLGAVFLSGDRSSGLTRLTSAVLRCFIAAIASDLRRRARRLGFRVQLKTGAMTVVQRFGSSLALNVHFHTLALDGVWTTRADGSLDFHPLPAPSDHDVACIARAVCRKVLRMWYSHRRS